MGRYSNKWLMLLAAGSLSLTLGCGESTVNVPGGDDPRDHEQPDIPGTSSLKHVEPCDPLQLSCARSLPVDGSTTLSVRLVDADGNPIRNAMIGFQLERESGAEGSSLSAANGITNADGIASTTVRTGSDPAVATGTLRVRASVGQEGVNTLDFNLGINAKDTASYIVKHTHGGTAILDTVNTSFLPADMTCAELEDEFAARGYVTGADFALNATVNADGSVNNLILNSVPNNQAYTIFSVAIRNVGARQVIAALGCTDNNPPVQSGVNSVVDVDLYDYIPSIAGIYKVTHTFNIVSGLPPAVADVLSLIGTLATSPAQFILGCPATQSYCPPGGTRGLLDFILDYAGDSLGSFAETLRDFQDSAALALALDFLDDAIEGFLPSWATDAQVIIDDVISMLEEFTVEGDIQIMEEPVIDIAAGQTQAVLHAENNVQRWNDIVLQWSRGCEGQAASCSEVLIRSFEVGEGGSAVYGNFGATMIGSTALKIEKHPLTLQYGSLILAVIEKVLLPRLFNDGGPVVDSLDAMLDRFVDCTALATEVNSDETSTFHRAVKQACEVMKTEAAGAVRDYVNDNLVADSEDNFRIGTPAGEPCELYQPDVYPPTPGSTQPALPFIQHLGKAEPELRCKWEAEFRFSTESSATVLDGTFHGSRSDSGN
ncbi:Ig-like domain-containing protein [Lujinxingia litoralis]|nr:Ig-like domain-containing protein [Lujinxingia litoralis]